VNPAASLAMNPLALDMLNLNVTGLGSHTKDQIRTPIWIVSIFVKKDLDQLMPFMMEHSPRGVIATAVEKDIAEAWPCSWKQINA